MAEALPVIGRAAIGASPEHAYLGEQRRKGPDGGGLGRALFAANQNSTDPGVDGVQDQRPFHGGLTDDGRKGKPGLGPLLQWVSCHVPVYPVRKIQSSV
jgi:hypothetical protein